MIAYKIITDKLYHLIEQAEKKMEYYESLDPRDLTAQGELALYKGRRSGFRTVIAELRDIKIEQEQRERNQRFPRPPGRSRSNSV